MADPIDDEQGRGGLAGTAIALFVASFAYLWTFRNEGIFHLDAVYLAQTVEQMYAGGPWDVRWRFGAVLANALVHFPFWLLGENAERATILASILFHAASIAMVLLFLERLCGIRLLAALSAGLLAVAPVFSVANTFGKEYGLAVFLVSTSFYLALRARDAASATLAAASAVCFALSYTVWEGLLGITPIWVMVLFAPRLERPRWDARTRRLAAGGLVGFAFGLGFGLATSLVAMVRTYAGTPTMTKLDLASPQLGAALGDLVLFLGPPFLLASAAGLVVTLRRRRYRALLPLALMLVATIVVYGNLSTYGPRYLVLCTLGLAMLAGAALHAMLARGTFLRWTAIATYVTSIAWMIAVSYPLLAPRHTYNGAKRYAQLIAEVTEPDSTIIVMDDHRFVEYYARRETLQHPIGDPAATANWVQTVRDTMARGPVYLAESGLSYDPGALVRKAIDDNFTMTLVGTRLTEDFHHAEGRRRVYEASLWRLEPR
ncbi:MAG: hypothetical protein KIT14_06960 [bacterium]|nr:hypothetical protein [bacterium]